MEATASIRRARPLLGTFVEIAATGPAPEAAVEAAFAAVAEVHRLMSFHEPDSDVSRLNRGAASGAVRVHDWTYQVLATALDLNRRSAGIFDVAVAPALQTLGLLPYPPDDNPPRVDGAIADGMAPPSPSPRTCGERVGVRGSCRTFGLEESPLTRIASRSDLSPQAGRGQAAAATGDAIQLLPANRVRFAHRSVRIDLGGIAKGFAVDRAVEALYRHGIAEGLVNAGGDLSAFGPRSHAVDVRDPRQPDRPMCRIAVNNAALASSAGRFDPLRARDPSGCAVIDPATALPVEAVIGATVRAPCCVIADALTKIVMNAGEGAAPILERYGAGAMFVSAQGEVHVTAGWTNEVRFAA
jgi:FAD:protein FMN transferase